MLIFCLATFGYRPTKTKSGHTLSCTQYFLFSTESFSIALSVHSDTTSLVYLQEYGYFVELGKTVRLTCTVNSPNKPTIFWTFKTYNETKTWSETSPTLEDFSVDGFAWKSETNIDNFSYDTTGSYACNTSTSNIERSLTLVLKGKIDDKSFVSI